MQIVKATLVFRKTLVELKKKAKAFFCTEFLVVPNLVSIFHSMEPLKRLPVSSIKTYV